MFSRYRISILVTVLGLISVAPSANCTTFHDLDVSERCAQLAYNVGFDPAGFEKTFDQLLEAYRQSGDVQGEIWALYDFDFDLKAKKLENDLILRLQTENVVRDETLVGERVIVRLLKLSSGVMGVFRPLGAPFSSPGHDVLAYQLDRALEFHLVPVTVTREYHGEIGSLQAYVKFSTHGDRDFRKSEYANEKLHVFDYLTNQIDRHSGNWLYRPGGHIVAIDNTAMLTSEVHEKLRASRQVTADLPPKHLSPEIKRSIRRLENQILTHPDAFQFANVRDRASLLHRIQELLHADERCASLLVD